MYRRKPALFIYVILIVALSACNLPSSTADATATPDLALTLTALASTGGQPVEPVGPQDTATPQFTATPGPTETPSIPQVTVSTDTNCRTGPGVVYDNIGALFVGQVGTVVGKNSSTGYWIINNPGKTGTCWYATVSGNTANLQEYSIPPTPTPTATSTPTQTPTPSIPAAVNNPTIAKNCVLVNPVVPQTYLYQGVLSWEDKSNNEDGFNIYQNGALLVSLPANTTSFNLPPFGPFPVNVPVQYGVEAFNTAGKAPVKIVVMICP